MKTVFSIVLVIVGFLLILTPSIRGLIGTSQILEVIVSTGKDVDFHSSVPSYYDTICIMFGMLSFVIGVLLEIYMFRVQKLIRNQNQ